MKEILRNKNLAFIGGGIACKAILQILLAKTFSNEGWDIIGVADINNKAEGLLYAREKGIFTTLEYKDLYGFKELDLIFELTGDDKILEEIRATKPSDIVLIDHFEAMSVWDFLQIEEMRVRIRGKLRKLIGDPEKVETEFDLFSQQLGKIVKERTRHLQSVEKELVERDRVLSQIVQGNTIPTFVINRDHIVTHWNRACEKLTGYKADEIVGTSKQWMPFRPFERPSMADVIVDEMEEKEIERYYGDKWRKSALIEGAYEAEEFFLNMGENGKWLFFTAAPLKDPGGKTIGAIETLWDRTEDKNAEEERERHNRELSALSSITEALSMSLDLENRLKAAVLEIFKSLPVDSVCIFILEADGSFSLRYYYGISEVLFQKKGMMETEDIMYRMAQRREPTIFEDISENDKADIGLFVSEGLKSLAYVPIRAEVEKLLGVIRMGSKNSKIFAPEEKRILGLIGNRIAVAIESSTFHEEHMKSEERYRLLFNTNPNPIFIVDRETFEIMDVNARAQDCYRYSKDELLGMNYLDLEDRGNELIEN
ncbi:MAG: PAS domain S-box protein, partial [Pseudomonadota bacterium]